MLTPPTVTSVILYWPPTPVRYQSSGIRLPSARTISLLTTVSLPKGRRLVTRKDAPPY